MGMANCQITQGINIVSVFFRLSIIFVAVSVRVLLLPVYI